MKHTAKLILVVLVLFALGSFALAADTDTIGYRGGPNNVVVVYWKAGAGGVKTDVTLPARDASILMVATNPGTEAPDDNYDIYILDFAGVDVMGGQLENRDASTNEQAVPKIGSAYGARPVTGPLTMTFTMMGAGDEEGEVFVYYDK